MSTVEAPVKLSELLKEWPDNQFDINNYLEFQQNGEEYVVACAIGSLYLTTAKPKRRKLLNWAREFYNYYEEAPLGDEEPSTSEVMIEHLKTLGLSETQARCMEDIGLNTYEEYYCDLCKKNWGRCEVGQKEAKNACVEYLQSIGM